jgi:hypothetical protein
MQPNGVPWIQSARGTLDRAIPRPCAGGPRYAPPVALERPIQPPGNLPFWQSSSGSQFPAFISRISEMRVT